MSPLDDVTRIAIEAAEQLARDLRDGRARVLEYECRPQTREVHYGGGLAFAPPPQGAVARELLGPPVSRIVIAWGTERCVLARGG